MVALKHYSVYCQACQYGEKQERRGGIETRPPAPASGLRPPGSRNAVVALKPRLGCRPVPGGKRSRNAVVALKRARAGMARAESRMEAGTPWWH